MLQPVPSSAEDTRLADVFSLAYEELRRLATSVRRRDPSMTLSPTALVHEAWLKLAESPRVAETGPLRFRRIAARAMRQVLVDAARRRNASKRGSGAALVTFDESLGTDPSTPDHVLVLHEVLDELARVSPRQAMLVESRFFGGFEMREVAELLGVSESTALREWRAARAFIGHEMKRRMR